MKTPNNSEYKFNTTEWKDRLTDHLHQIGSIIQGWIRNTGRTDNPNIKSGQMQCNGVHSNNQDL